MIAVGKYKVTVTDKPGGNYQFANPVEAEGAFEITASSQNPLYESVNIMPLAHRIITCFAKTALAARYDLLGYHTVSFLDACYIFSISDNTSHKLMSADNRRFYVALLWRRPPYAHTAVQCLYIPGTDSAAFNLYKNFIIINLRHR